jgi:3-oxoacyl-[acyl-carrier-protein] synthase II
VTHSSSHQPRVAITGLGLRTSIGANAASTWAALLRGQSGVRAITRFPTKGLRTTIAATIDDIPLDPLCAPLLSEALARQAASEAVQQANLGEEGHFPGRLFMAVPPVEIEWSHRMQLAKETGVAAPTYHDLLKAAREHTHIEWHDRFLFGTVADRLAESFGTQGAPISLSTACSSGATAIQLGVEAIRRGETKAALCIGTDGSVHAESLVRFSLLSALSTQNHDPARASKPFSKNRDGFVMGEGAAALVLEDADHAEQRGARIYAYLAGCGEKGDGFHRTRSSPDGAPIIHAIRASLADAGLDPEAIDAINAHGTSTPENDRMEVMGCRTVFKDTLPPMSSNKSMLGHTLTAAGAIEAAISVLTLMHQVLPPTINYDEPDPALDVDVVANVARPAKVNAILSNSFGFGGQNTCLVLTKGNF